MLRIAASLALFCFSQMSFAVEINGSPYNVDDAPLPAHMQTYGEKIVIVDPTEHAWGAYDITGRLLRWGIATAGADYCADIKKPCRTTTGQFRIYSLGRADCISNTYPYPGGGASMPYCMYFTGTQAIHGSNEVRYENSSHGCVRVHVDDAKWLRFQFVEGPTLANHYRGTKIIIKAYEQARD